MKELINIHIGQAGSQIGNACWEYFTQQHGIMPDGYLSTQAKAYPDDSTLLFYETSQGKHVPRSIYVDLQPTVIDEVRTGQYGRLFNPSYLISGKDDTAGNHCRGQYTIGKQYIDQTLDAVRKVAQKSSYLEGFLMSNSICGGTGSGFGVLLQERLRVEYGKKLQVGLTIFPSLQTQPQIIAPYNSVLSVHEMLQYNDLAICFNNEALYDICLQKLGIQAPNYRSINQLIAKVASQMTLPMRFKGHLNTNLKEISTNMVAYRRIHFLMPSFAPYVETQKGYQSRVNVNDITSSVFSPQNQMIKCNPLDGLYMGCSLFYSGDVTPKETIDAITEIRSKSTISFVDWCPTGFKVSINDRSPHLVKNQAMGKSERSCCLLSNNSSIVDIFDKNNQKFDCMYAKRAFVHWYVGEGLDQGFFFEAREDLAALEMDYRQVTHPTVDSVDD